LNDGVMGGVSQSTMQSGEGCAIFAGVVSTDNSGGFASVRTRNFDPAIDVSDYSGIKLRLKGDGNRYKFFLRDSDGWDTIAYAFSFDTRAGEWISVQIPFAQLIPVARAKTVPNARPIDPRQVRSLQLMLSKFEYDGGLNPHFRVGRFELNIATLSVYRSR
jgi:hypothetical protein